MPAPLPPPPTPRPDVPRRPGDRPCVLIVEDSYMLLELLVTLCEQHGVATLTASSGEAALMLLREHGARIDWLLTDIRLPGLVDGWSVAEAFRQIQPHRPVIYSSTTANLHHPAVSGSIFVTKPYVIGDILRLARMMGGEMEQARRLSA
ncbi:response regulator [Methylobacterium sp. IF7SW-B2]|jgi:two-component system OmpR family response regulator|nr:response regulator [Methylobacterium ajmalii]MBK3410292.1 response regulator [Methylobacterium ajmalii]MBK3421010.1 response regulator [Methylobacterium ajmalii]SFF23666.1 CheY chemotaxis protein or a CheY-like REC (receiver) domain [Methylobacterium sp. yr596]